KGAVGERGGCRVTAVNRGPNLATGVVIHAGIITGVSFVRAEAPPGTFYDAASLSWVIGDLAVGQSLVLTGVVEIVQSGKLLNEAFRTHNEPDPNPANDRDAVVLNAAEVADI